MDLISDNIFWILIAAGVVTSTMLATAVAPARVFQGLFGASLEGRLGDLLMRNWGLLIGMSGLLLIYAAWDENIRVPVMLFSIVGKLSFAAYVLAAGAELKAARGGAVLDLIISGLFIAYLVSL